MGGKNYYVSGSHNVTCDVCSRKIKSGQARKRWDGFIVCPDDYETRHPQDFVRARQDKISVPFTRPRPPDAFRLMNPLTDTIMASDDDNMNDYMMYNVTEPYFLEDYILEKRSFVIIMKWNSAYMDSVTNTDSYTITQKPYITDAVTLLDSVFIRSIYRPMLNDTYTVSESGEIFLNTYIESTYFAEKYVGTLTTF